MSYVSPALQADSLKICVYLMAALALAPKQKSNKRPTTETQLCGQVLILCRRAHEDT